MTHCKIMKSFPYSHDGVNAEQAVKGETVDIPDNLVAGLKAAGFVNVTGKPETKHIPEVPETGAPVEGAKPDEPISVPENFRELPYNDLMALANKVSDETVRSTDDCIAAIELYLAE